MKQRMVGTVMTSDVVRAGPGVPFKRLAALLAEHGISGLPVVDDDEKVLGVVSEGDLMGRRPAADAPTAGELMTAPAITVRATDPVAQAARVMADRHVKRLPVLDEEGRLVGIVSRRDVLRVFLRPDAEIRSEVIDVVLVRSLWLPDDAVEVTVAGGVVTLRGQVERSGDVPIALRMTAQTDGVVAVVDRLTYRRDA